MVNPSPQILNPQFVAKIRFKKTLFSLSFADFSCFGNAFTNDLSGQLRQTNYFAVRIHKNCYDNISVNAIVAISG